MRRSLRRKRNEVEFRAVKQWLLATFEQLASGGCEFELWFFDEAGFTLTPSVPYAWQPNGERIELDSFGNQRRRHNVLGFLRWDGGDFYAAVFEGSLNNHLVGGVLREFAKAKKSDKPKLIILDNAPAHRGDEIEEELEELAKEGVCVMFLPGYSPELNVIELLWQKIKYQWLPLDIYENFQRLTEGLFEVLKGIGSKYRITFA